MFEVGDIVRLRKNRLDKDAKRCGWGNWVMLVENVTESTSGVFVLDMWEFTQGKAVTFSAADVMKTKIPGIN